MQDPHPHIQSIHNNVVYLNSFTMPCTCAQNCSSCGPASSNSCNCVKGECVCANCANKAHATNCGCKGSGKECTCAQQGKACTC